MRRVADLLGDPVIQAEQLERVAVLAVVVDPARVRRRRDQPVERRAPGERARIRMVDGRIDVAAHLREGRDPSQRVEGVAAQELARVLRRAARAAVLVAPVRLRHRAARRVEVEVRRAPGGARGARRDHALDVGGWVVWIDQGRVAAQVGERRARTTRPGTRRRPGRVSASSSRASAIGILGELVSIGTLLAFVIVFAGVWALGGANVRICRGRSRHHGFPYSHCQDAGMSLAHAFAAR